MDLRKKIETLLNATVRASLPRRERRTALDQQEEELLTEVRQALAQTEIREREIADRLKAEQAKAAAAAQRGDPVEQRAHEIRAAELERHVEQESLLAIDLEQKLAALEEKLDLAKSAVDKQAKVAAQRDEAATQAMAQSGRDSRLETLVSATFPEASQDEVAADDKEITVRKSRLAE